MFDQQKFWAEWLICQVREELAKPVSRDAERVRWPKPEYVCSQDFRSCRRRVV